QLENWSKKGTISLVNKKLAVEKISAIEGRLKVAFEAYKAHLQDRAPIVDLASQIPALSFAPHVNPNILRMQEEIFDLLVTPSFERPVYHPVGIRDWHIEGKTFLKETQTLLELVQKANQGKNSLNALEGIRNFFLTIPLNDERFWQQVDFSQTEEL